MELTTEQTMYMIVLNVQYRTPEFTQAVFKLGPQDTPPWKGYAHAVVDTVTALPLRESMHKYIDTMDDNFLELLKEIRTAKIENPTPTEKEFYTEYFSHDNIIKRLLTA